jgi:hypothetical protein
LLFVLAESFTRVCEDPVELEAGLALLPAARWARRFSSSRTESSNQPMVRCASRILASQVRMTSWFEVALRMAWKPSRILRSLTMRACSEASLAPRSACD